MRFGQVQEDRATLEQDQRGHLSALFKQNGYFAKGIKSKNMRRELFPCADIDAGHAVMKAKLLKQDCHAMRIGRRPAIKMVVWNRRSHQRPPSQHDESQAMRNLRIKPDFQFMAPTT
jgi:hypothetical protein